MKTLFTELVLICLLISPGCSVQKNKAVHKETAFPRSMVGVWETEKHFLTSKKWGIKFEEDGSVKKVIHNLAGPINLSEGGVTLGDLESDDYAVFVMGPCTTKYDAQNKFLEVDIVVDNFVIKKGTIYLEGNATDRFSGPVPKNGQVWEVERRTFATLDGTDPISEEFAENHPDKVTFYKIDLDKKPADQ